jgi:hypothetical protein
MTFGAVFDVVLEDVAIETYLPADESTARHCQELDTGTREQPWRGSSQ